MNFTELLDKLDVKWISEGHHHCTAGWVQLDCPFCGESGKWRLGYNLRGGYCNCWSCGAFTAHSVLVELGATRELLKQFDKQHFRQYESPVTNNRHLRLPKGLGPLRSAHKRYLRKRGFDPSELQKLWQIQGIGELGGSLSWRVFIPIIVNGRTVSWTARSISDKHKRRYRNASDQESVIPRSKLLYGADYCKHVCLALEGPTKVWRVGPGSVATLGINYSRTQLELLARYPVRIICFDGETIAQKQARKLCRELSAFDGRTHNVVLDSSRDAAEASDEEIVELRRKYLD